MHPLFANILFLGPQFAPVILRIFGAVILGIIAKRLLKNKNEITKHIFPLIGTPKKWMIATYAAVTALAALSLLFGLYTQAGAALGALIALKHFLAPKRFSAVLPLSREAYVLLFGICLALIILGAGAFGFDGLY